MFYLNIYHTQRYITQILCVPFCNFFSQLEFYYFTFGSVCQDKFFTSARLYCLLFVFIYQSFFFLHFPPNIAHPFSVKQRIKPPKPDHPPCNLATQMTNTRCFSEALAANGSRCPWWQLVCMTKCTTLMAAKAWLDTPLSFPFTLRCLLTPEMLELMWK